MTEMKGSGLGDQAYNSIARAHQRALLAGAAGHEVALRVIPPAESGASDAPIEAIESTTDTGEIPSSLPISNGEQPAV